jgi:hypothetical protein
VIFAPHARWLTGTLHKNFKRPASFSGCAANWIQNYTKHPQTAGSGLFRKTLTLADHCKLHAIRVGFAGLSQPWDCKGLSKSRLDAQASTCETMQLSQKNFASG